MADLFGERPIVVGRELTKLHQTIYRGSATSIAAAGVEPRGEFTVMLGPAVIREDTHIPPADEQISLEFGSMTKNDGGSRRDILRVLAKRHGIPVRDVYAALERQKTR
jgi:16S rRNA (cytidine1402-2'-O)-methyltransferase